MLELGSYDGHLEYRPSVAMPPSMKRRPEIFYVIDGSATLMTGGKLVKETRTNSTNLSGSALKVERRAPSQKEISFSFRKTRRIGSAPSMVCLSCSRCMCRARDVVPDKSPYRNVACEPDWPNSHNPRIAALLGPSRTNRLANQQRRSASFRGMNFADGRPTPPPCRGCRPDRR